MTNFIVIYYNAVRVLSIKTNTILTAITDN